MERRTKAITISNTLIITMIGFVCTFVMATGVFLGMSLMMRDPGVVSLQFESDNITLAPCEGSFCVPCNIPNPWGTQDISVKPGERVTVKITDEAIAQAKKCLKTFKMGVGVAEVTVDVDTNCGSCVDHGEEYGACVCPDDEE